MQVKMPGTAAKSVSMLTLGVKDVQRSVAFYEAMGWEYSPDSDGACTYVLSSNIAIGLLPHDFLAKEIGLPVEPIPRYNGLLLAINGENAGEVDAIFERAVAAGASVQQKPVWKDWDGKPGYSGFIMDPDGSVWELAYAPALRIGEDNRLLPTTKAEAAAGKDTKQNRPE